MRRMTHVMDLSAQLRDKLGMTEPHELKHDLWPRWATWALIGVAITLVVTVFATLNDIY